MTEARESIRLVASQKAQSAQMLARAFLEDPAYSAIFPDGDERERSLRSLFGAVIGYSLVYGLIHTTPTVSGVACWLSPGNTEITLWRILRTGLGLQRAVARFKPQARKEFLETLAYMDEIHKREVPDPHWYLWALGVAPEHQGQGIGSRLIQPVLAQADRDGVPCHLETQTEGNVSFYQHRGFEIVSDGWVAEREIRVWMMLREAQQ
ncbi:MAG: GNAT family N-acetyltransferase [Anaerolineae bacterium]|jgi:ribosomal protein S18 acetylase RimI-like enzyme